MQEKDSNMPLYSNIPENFSVGVSKNIFIFLLLFIFAALVFFTIEIGNFCTICQTPAFYIVMFALDIAIPACIYSLAKTHDSWLTAVYVQGNKLIYKGQEFEVSDLQLTFRSKYNREPSTYDLISKRERICSLYDNYENFETLKLWIEKHNDDNNVAEDTIDNNVTESEDDNTCIPVSAPNSEQTQLMFPIVGAIAIAALIYLLLIYRIIDCFNAETFSPIEYFTNLSGNEIIAYFLPPLILYICRYNFFALMTAIYIMTNKNVIEIKGNTYSPAHISLTKKDKFTILKYNKKRIGVITPRFTNYGTLTTWLKKHHTKQDPLSEISVS